MTSRRRRAFTLLEVSVAIAIFGGLIGIVAGMAAVVIQQTGRSRARAELVRSANFVSLLLNNELRAAGVGVPPPTKEHITTTYAGGITNSRFTSVVILANGTAVGIVGDLPRQDAQYNPMGVLAGEGLGTGGKLFWHNENNGMCAPPTTAGAPCSTASTSVFFPGSTVQLCNSAFTDRSCPWGMRRMVANERFQVVDANGNWAHLQFGNTFSNGAGSEVAAAVTGWPTSGWPNASVGDLPIGNGGQGWVTSIDRVFFYLDSTNTANRKLMRIQCAGDPNPNISTWPNDATNITAATLVASGTSALTSTPTGGSANTCQAPEVVASNITNTGDIFTYYDNTSNTTALAATSGVSTKSAIRRIDYNITFSKTVYGRSVSTTAIGTVRIRNR